ncbi:hypothetical protein [Algicella marina]|uniref:Outer membrane protein beta-barrel domain-containing protein n=1 Tax=Algicella marina TaxID=2683284 RepID=A0A6P1SWC8_9RHOB|nr:hypothetical protein [Algicella marina]QHQ34748.1 hypothetical protein GO499_05840 [Algicella marina]
MKIRTAVATICATLGAAPALAGPLYDTTFQYYARDNVGGTDNDIIRNTTGLTFGDDGYGSRFALSLGVRNSFFDGDFPVEAQFEALRFRQWRSSTVGFGGRIGGYDGGDMTAEGMVYGLREWGKVSARGLVGLQAVSGEGGFADNRDVGAFALAEFSYYPVDELAFRFGLAADDIDVLGSVGMEFAANELPLSFFAEWTLALNRYRTDEYYNDFTFGFRISSPFSTLQERDRKSQRRALYRPVDPQ